MNFIDALPRARVPLDVAILWQRHTSELRALSPAALRDAWRSACKRICVLRANLSLKAAHILLRSELKASDGEYVLPSPESEDVPSSNAMGTLSAAVSDAKFTADVARALVDLSDKLRAENSFDAARSLCVDRIKFILKLTDFAGCSALLDAEIKRVQNEPPECERVNKVLSARLPPETLSLIARILAAREITVATWITQHAVEDAAKLNP